MNSVVIAIDGPSASGKSTLARRLASALGFLHVDTGAMYRTFAWWAVGKRLCLQNEKELRNELLHWNTRHMARDGELHLLINGYFPAHEIRRPETTDAASKIAVHPTVRAWMVSKQRESARFGSLVMEGRDIGTKVFPEAPLKFFIDASAEARAKRREGSSVSLLAERDQRDSLRRGDPLMPALDAIRIDNSHETVEQSLARMLDWAQKRLALNPSIPTEKPLC